VPATPTVTPFETTPPGTFTTLVPPSGAHLFTMCWANDVHIGEMTSGLAISNGSLPGGGFPPGFAADPADPYWRFMAKAAVDEGKARGAELMLFAGDLTSEAEPVNLAEARAIFDRFGMYKDAYHVTRGNHDRAHSGATWDECTPVANDEYNDCLVDAFFPDGQTYFSFDHQGVHVVGLDTNELTTGSGAIAPEQFEWLEADLDAHGGRPTFLFGHHPVTQEAGLTAIPPVVFTLNQADAERLEGQVAEHSVVGVYSGHTHRNKRTSSSRAPGVPFIELGAVKEYPGGYGLVKVYEGGYMVSFYKTKADPSRAWSERSRGEYLGLYPYYTLGTLADRSFVVEADLSDAARNPAAPTAPGGSTTGDGALPATGGTGALAAGTVALTAAAVARAAASAS
jgi:3',5'-cyclic AMP phosphodiesterase CpdA